MDAAVKIHVGTDEKQKIIRWWPFYTADSIKFCQPKMCYCIVTAASTPNVRLYIIEQFYSNS